MYICLVCCVRSPLALTAGFLHTSLCVNWFYFSGHLSMARLLSTSGLEFCRTSFTTRLWIASSSPRWGRHAGGTWTDSSFPGSDYEVLIACFTALLLWCFLSCLLPLHMLHSIALGLVILRARGVEEVHPEIKILILLLKFPSRVSYLYPLWGVCAVVTN